MSDAITWTFVWQGAMTDDEASEFAEKQPERIGIVDMGGLWLEAAPEQCERDGHVPRLHPDESFQSYCVICGAYPVEDPTWKLAAERMHDPEFQQRYRELFGDCDGTDEGSPAEGGG